MFPFKPSNEERARKVKAAFENIYELMLSPKWNQRQRNLFTKQVFDFFERNEVKEKSLAGIEWTDYTRFPRTQKGALLAVQCFIEDLDVVYPDD